jgi:tetratricopeptide (TPR) repeat protein
LRVISLGSVLRFKGKQVDPQVVGRELNVRAVLVGRMTRLGDALVISVELVDVRDNRRLWGGQYNRKPSDVLAVQEEIAGEIAEKLRLRLSGPVKERLTKQSTGSTAAYDAYARGRFLLQKRTGRTTRKSIEYFEEAIRHDRGYGPAYASLSYAYWTLGNYGMIPQEEALSKAEEAARRALEIDDTLAEAHSALGHVRHTRRDWVGAESAFRRGIELNPNSAFAHSNYAFYFIAVRRFDEAVAESKRAVELEPTSALYNRNVALNLYFARRYDETIEQSLKTLELDPNMTTAYWWLARAYEQKGLHDQAVAAYLRGEELSGTDVVPLKEAYTALGWEGYWRKSLELTKQQAGKGRVDSWDIAGIYARLGEKDQAFAWLKKAYNEPNWSITTLNADPVLDGLRSDPRYADLVRRMGLEP